jgi:Amt family ammonium transporter
MDVAAIMFLGAAALLVRVGYACYATGLSRSKCAASAVLRQLLDLCVATLAFWAIGAAIFHYDAGAFIGLEAGRLIDWRGGSNGVTFFGLVFVLVASGLFPASVGERSKLLPTCLASVVTAAIVVPIAAQWAWNGWLARRGFTDAAGASVVHVAGAMVAAAGAFVVGPRSGKYNRDGSANMIPGHNLPLASIGVVVILIGWIPYVLGATALGGGLTGRTPINVLLAGAAGGVVSLLVGRWKYGKIDVMLTYAGLLGGLIAVTGGASMFPTSAAVATGAVAGLLVPLAVIHLDLTLKIDDPAMVIAIHGAGGAWGTVAVGLFLNVPMASRFRFILTQMGGVIVIALLAAGVALGVMYLLKRTIGVRSKEADEFDGLDLAEHDLNAYPDFQQTMIKSYHLREA